MKLTLNSLQTDTKTTISVLNNRVDKIEDNILNSIDQLSCKLEAHIHDSSYKSGRIGERFDSVNQRFNVIDKRFDRMDKRLDGMDKRFDSVEQSIAELKHHIVHDVLGALNR